MDDGQKKTVLVSVATVCMALLLVVGVGYAAFQTGLNINGTATVKASSWKIKFESLGAVSTTGTAVETTAPKITGDTTIGDYAVQVTTPGDTVSYTFDVKNEGTFDAKLDTLTVGTPSCTGTGANATTDASNVCKNLTYTLTYVDGGSAVAANDTLTAGQSRKMKVTLTYNANATVEQLPKGDVTISDLGITMNYAQA